MEMSLARVKPEYLYSQVKNIYFVFRNKAKLHSTKGVLSARRDDAGAFRGHRQFLCSVLLLVVVILFVLFCF